MQPQPPDSLEQARAANARLSRARERLAALSRARDEALRQALRDGHSLRTVAAATGMSWSGVRDRVRQLDD